MKDQSTKPPKKRNLIILLGFLLIMTTILIYINTSNPKIEYEVVNGYSGYHSILNLNKNKSYSLLLTTQRGSITKKIEGNISNQQMKAIRRALIKNRFITLNNNISDHSVTDNSIEKLKVKLGFLSFGTEGYGITNKRFRDIVEELERLTATQR
jgi:hypothetical protein